METIIDFFNHPFFIVIGGITTAITLLGFPCMIIAITWWGVIPFLYRVGKSLWKRKVAIIGDNQARSSLYESIKDSGLFKKNNLDLIDVDNVTKLKMYDTIIVDWGSCSSVVDKIFSAQKSHNTSIIVFAKPGGIPAEKMTEIANAPSTVVVNFKGRLLNDILVSMITTSFDSK